MRGMRLLKISFTVCAFAAVMSAAPAAEDRKSIPPLDKSNPLKELISGYYYSLPKTRAMQDDDFDNPGFLWFDQGEALWQKTEGAEGKSCVSCHQKAAASMRGVAAQYPKYYPPLKRVITLEQRINMCRQEKMKAEPWKHESKDLLGMTIFVRNQSRGMPVNVNIDGPARPVFELGEKIYNTKIGQLEMSCAQCHNLLYGQNLRSDLLSQGHSNGFPTYRLREQTMLSIHERLRGCYVLIRAQPHAYSSDEYVALELYLAWRGKGLPVETPSVRR